jgi:hypothetical protein
MKKVALKLDDPQVSSFETEQVQGRSGTVQGNAKVSGVSCQWSDC